MSDLLTTIALLWTIHIFLFSEADKHLSDFLGKARFAISINPKNQTLESDDFQFKQHLNARQIYEFGEQLNDKKMTRVFYNKYQIIERWKIGLLINISLLTLFEFINWCSFLEQWLHFHIFITFIISGYFYYLTSQLSTVKLSGFKSDPLPEHE